LAGFFAAAFFVAMSTPPPFEKLHVIAVFGIAEFASGGKCSLWDFFCGDMKMKQNGGAYDGFTCYGCALHRNMHIHVSSSKAVVL
jgi:hypothetical protein